MNSKRALLAALHLLPSSSSSHATAFLSTTATSSSATAASRAAAAAAAAATVRPTGAGALALGALSFSSLGRPVSAAASVRVV